MLSPRAAQAEKKGWRARGKNAWRPAILFSAVATAPFFFGLTDIVPLAVWCVWLAVAVCCADAFTIQGRHFAVLVLLFVLVCAYGFVLHEQLSAEPWFARVHPLWAEASKALGQPIVGLPSITRDQPWIAMGAPIANLLAFLGGFLCCQREDRARQLIRVIAWSGAAYAVYGILSLAFTPTLLLWRPKLAYLSSVTGTFVSRNTASVYFGGVAIIWAILLCQIIRKHMGQGSWRWSSLRRHLFDRPSPEMVAAFAALFTCISAMFLTGSRAGVALSIALLPLSVAAYLRKRLSTRFAMASFVLSAGAVVMFLFQIMGAGIVERFEVQGLADGGRWETYKSSWRIVTEFPWFGTGQGSFAWVYPAYRSDAISGSGVWDRAHNTPLEMAVELGLPLTGLVSGSWIAGVVALMSGLVIQKRGTEVIVTGLCVITLATLHSLVDFSLQIPGFSIVVTCLFGAALSQCLGPSIGKQRGAPQDSPLSA